MYLGPQCFGWKVVYSYSGTVTHGFNSVARRLRRSFATQCAEQAIGHYNAIRAAEYQYPGLAVTLYEKTKPSGGWRRCRRYLATSLIEAAQAKASQS